MKKHILFFSTLLLIILLIGCQQKDTHKNNNLIEQPNDAVTTTESKLALLADDWANALKTRDGKPRYDMMSEKAKVKFEKEQINRSGEQWNFNIGYSSPWVVDYDIQIDGMTATIIYDLTSSEPANYTMTETIIFVTEGEQFLVDDYEITSEVIETILN